LETFVIVYMLLHVAMSLVMLACLFRQAERMHRIETDVTDLRTQLHETDSILYRITDNLVDVFDQRVEPTE